MKTLPAAALTALFFATTATADPDLARLRPKLPGRQERSRPGLDQASVTKPNSAAEASIGLFGSTRTV
jgi:hypothetical protein